MSQATLTQIFDRLGSLTAKVDTLAGNVERTTREAAEHRGVIHKRVDELIGEVNDVKISVNDLSGSLDDVKTDVAETKEVTDKVKQWEQRGIGALAAAGIVGTAFGGSIVYFFSEIAKAFRA